MLASPAADKGVLQQLLFIETVLKLSGGLVLLLAPLTAAHVFGLSKPQSGFWPRLLGAVLIGLAGATYLEAVKHDGLSMAGCVVINLTVSAVIIILLLLGAAATSRRGRAALGLLAIMLAGLAFFEIAFISS